jgi:hypothetical protein
LPASEIGDPDEAARQDRGLFGGYSDSRHSTRGAGGFEQQEVVEQGNYCFHHQKEVNPAQFQRFVLLVVYGC